MVLVAMGRHVQEQSSALAAARTTIVAQLRRTVLPTQAVNTYLARVSLPPQVQLYLTSQWTEPVAVQMERCAQVRPLGSVAQRQASVVRVPYFARRAVGARQDLDFAWRPVVAYILRMDSVGRWCREHVREVCGGIAVRDTDIVEGRMLIVLLLMDVSRSMELVVE